MRTGKLDKTSKVLKLLSNRYGLNALGVKKLLQIDGTRYNKLVSDAITLNSVEKKIITTVFQELEGKIK